MSSEEWQRLKADEIYGAYLDNRKLIDELVQENFDVNTELSLLTARFQRIEELLYSNQTELRNIREALFERKTT